MHRGFVLFVSHENYILALPVQTKVHEVRDQVDLEQPLYPRNLVMLRMEKDIILVYASNALGEAIPETVNSG